MDNKLITAVTELDNQNYLTKVYAGGHFIYADEPAGLGGGDQGMTPGALLLASLGSCTAITLKMYADRKKIDIGQIRIHLTICREEDMDAKTVISRKIDFGGNLSAELRDRLLYIADKCPIHKMLSNPIQIDTVFG